MWGRRWFVGLVRLSCRSGGAQRAQGTPPDLAIGGEAHAVGWFRRRRISRHGQDRAGQMPDCWTGQVATQGASGYRTSIHKLADFETIHLQTCPDDSHCLHKPSYPAEGAVHAAQPNAAAPTPFPTSPRPSPFGAGRCIPNGQQTAESKTRGNQRSKLCPSAGQTAAR